MPSLRLTEEQVKEIRESIKNGTKTKDQIAAELNVGERSVRNILNGKHYSHVEGVIATKSKHSPLTDQQRDQIVSLYAVHHSMYVVADKTGISRNTIASVLKARQVVADGKSASPLKKQATIKIARKPAKPSEPKTVVKKIILLPERKALTLRRLKAAGWGNKEIADTLSIPLRDVKCYIEQQFDQV